MIVERRARKWSAAKQNLAHHHPQMSSKAGKGAAGTTGRLTLPGIGTVLEVPLLVAKRLHPNMGVRSHHPLHHPQHLGHSSSNSGKQQPFAHGRSRGSDGHFEGCSAGTSSEYNMRRSGNVSIEETPGSSSSGPITTRVYHHGKNRPTNLTLSHFPAIDEDSV